MMNGDGRAHAGGENWGWHRGEGDGGNGGGGGGDGGGCRGAEGAVD